MSDYRQPRSPIPPPIKGAEKGSFAYYTVVERLPDLCGRIVAENEFPPGIVENLELLAAELPEKTVRSLANSAAPDWAAWERYLAPYAGQNWLEIPWYFIEAYFYRRVLEATGYFQPLSEGYGVDPYAVQKRRGLENAMHSIQPLSAKLNELQGKWDKKGLVSLMYFSLWGNRIDLSLWPTEEGDRVFIEVAEKEENLLGDDSWRVAEFLEEKTPDRLDFILDNSGFELVCDLCLADFLLSTHPQCEIHWHVKPHPIFVSDAMGKDVRETVKAIANHSEKAVQALGDRLQGYLESDRLLLREDFFWTSPLVFWEMPDTLRQDIAESSLIFVKGDANYRRILGDRHWDFTTKFADIACYFPAPVVALRTLKSELACGVHPHQIETLNREVPEWLTNGTRGVIQFHG
ncbi:damage-control phosphatase ARMT1 family protein [Phormidium sp. CCY1219]|uniref:damage-control phosphatase ARMT1 family protein n=1 Tax=Phormidium sp. CCY1219 TaxID=2886104 RepID=UPI002D1F5FF8|nr:damage-control phosphatase ARMT1 family protein [Phormidium sp. CCY1219]MEB3830945.1 protein-glutamate O-methyltransferase family protein [Phormidium sp. CCY1219]